MFYEQLLHVKIPKSQKAIDHLTVFLCFCDLLASKQIVNMLGKSHLGVLNTEAKFITNQTKYMASELLLYYQIVSPWS